jgi:hypothetical protein
MLSRNNRDKRDCGREQKKRRYRGESEIIICVLLCAIPFVPLVPEAKRQHERKKLIARIPLKFPVLRTLPTNPLRRITWV